MSDGTEPIADDEILYRRIPASQDWYTPPNKVSPQAFRPRKEDVTGLSLQRARYTTIEQAAIGRSDKKYYVAVLKVGDIRAHGMEIIPSPREGNPGHAEIADLNYQNRKSDRAIELQTTLAHKLCVRVEGPFPRN